MNFASTFVASKILNKFRGKRSNTKRENDCFEIIKAPGNRQFSFNINLNFLIQVIQSRRRDKFWTNLI